MGLFGLVWLDFVSLVLFSYSDSGLCTDLETADSAGNSTLINLTPELLPILESILSPPEDQLKDATREKVSQLVKFIASKHPREVHKYPVLTDVASA